jgi:NAD(P)-dependent dehydrogenase (short-subunit alcohol dehydrogenase family)
MCFAAPSKLPTIEPSTCHTHLNAAMPGQITGNDWLYIVCPRSRRTRRTCLQPTTSASLALCVPFAHSCRWYIAASRIVNSTSASMTLASDPATPFSQSDSIVAYASSKATVTMVNLQYANAFRPHSSHAHIKINAATRGHIATGLNGHAGSRTVEQEYENRSGSGYTSRQWPQRRLLQRKWFIALATIILD